MNQVCRTVMLPDWNFSVLMAVREERSPEKALDAP